jgi:hypothetical protein
LAEHVGVNAPGKANNAMVLPAVALATSTGLGPMLQPLPSTSTNSVNVTAGSVSPTLIMFVPSKFDDCDLNFVIRSFVRRKKTTHYCESFLEALLKLSF